jgi:hypothetical protein
MNKKGTAERIKLSKSERQYVRGIIHNLSFQRWTSQEIADYLHEEKGLDIARITVNRIRNQVERQAEKWYIELRKSTFKYIAIYKERIDSLFSYQKKLHEIIKETEKDEVKLRAISELHSIEMDIFNLWKQLPNLDIVDSMSVSEPGREEEEKGQPMTFDEWFSKDYSRTHAYEYRIGNETDEENGKYYRELEKKYNDYVKEWNDRMFGPDPPDTESEAWTVDDKPKAKPKPVSEDKPIAATIVSAGPEITKQEERDEEGWKILKCPTCQKSFYNNFTLSAHTCNPNPSPIV